MWDKNSKPAAEPEGSPDRDLGVQRDGGRSRDSEMRLAVGRVEKPGTPPFISLSLPPGMDPGPKPLSLIPHTHTGKILPPESSMLGF